MHSLDVLKAAFLLQASPFILGLDFIQELIGLCRQIVEEEGWTNKRH